MHEPRRGDSLVPGNALGWAKHYLNGVAQWKGYPGKFDEYYWKAEGIIELLEVLHCGSIGGYDDGQPGCLRNLEGLQRRLEWLVDRLEVSDWQI
jgi:hypothetical protein